MQTMFNLHCHTFLSDGCLLPSEVAVRYAAAGYKAIAITDHADYSNIDMVLRAVTAFTKHWPKDSAIKVYPGVELTHLPPAQFAPLVKYARKKGARIVIGHGETVVEPVIKGTNRAAIAAGVDILAHPGLILDSDVRLAKARGVLLEITSRRGHANTNKYVAGRALKLGAGIVLNTDSHDPEDIISVNRLEQLGIKAGLSLKDIKNSYLKVGKLLQRR